ncbi:MAG: terpene cyclase/mutase family protein [Gemmataceae bacterium]|nr:terpene cyclase/mutase family protein [Gemmataceae bacterium]
MRLSFSLATALVLISAVPSWADEPLTLKNYKAPAENSKDEPLAPNFSLAKATDFLDNAALQWTDKRTCFSCHTNFAYLYARPLVSAKVPAHDEVRKALEEMVSVRWQEKGPRWDAEVVASAAALAFNDAHTTGKLHPVTKTALDRIWTVQQKDGGFRWLKCAWPPMENDDHYGVTLAALAVGFAPGDYAKTDVARKGLAQVRTWLRVNPPQNRHHDAMVLWVSTYLDGFMTKKEQHDTIAELLRNQRPDGGWNSASLGYWKRHRDEKVPQDYATADGYATGFVIYVLRRAGVPANDPAIGKGVAWLKSNQRESGRWYTRSLYKDNKHYLSHAGTSFAVMALAECQALSKPAGAD